ncbi:MAG: flagellar type III secretion system pore protein FliP [Clostridiales bacterium]|jgi:flagellar biosynthetic protein FliP|nr:flagellar type III secretion system pore protein FliP [Clostridiales bacterium]
MGKKKTLGVIITVAVILALFTAFAVYAYAAPEDEISIPNINIEVTPAETPAETSAGLQVILLLTVLSLAPSILIMMTSFTRIIIVLSFLRNAIGIQQLPPNQVLIGLALFLTLFVMTPVIEDIGETAYKPYMENKITQQQAFDNAIKPVREFMLRQTKTKDLKLFLTLSKSEQPEELSDIKTSVVIPAFLISELTRAFQIGFFLFIPFIIIDMVVSSTLMTMGMMMLPPMMISLPFKLLLFIIVDGWDLVIKTLVSGFI